jgi:hypothetical protein
MITLWVATAVRCDTRMVRGVHPPRCVIDYQHDGAVTTTAALLADLSSTLLPDEHATRHTNSHDLLVNSNH